MNVRKLTTAALAAALVCAVTFIAKVPLPSAHGAYVNLGDTVIYLCAWTIGGLPAALAAATGSALADLFAGAAVYMPATFVIKFLMGLLVARFAYQRGFARFLLWSIVAGVVMVGGYFCYELLLFGKVAFVNVPANVIQLVGGVAVAALLWPAVREAWQSLREGSQS
ncbi:MAG: ECF transporter S component [Actinomycetia bacterium]|nr:ECF transporter S component [Actinomycetes bacterium]